MKQYFFFVAFKSKKKINTKTKTKNSLFFWSCISPPPTFLFLFYLEQDDFVEKRNSNEKP